MQTTFIGTMDQCYTDTGVEEKHHLLFFAYKPLIKGTNQDTTSNARYNSEDCEYRALIRKLEAARDLGYHEDSIKFMERELKQAKAERERIRRRANRKSIFQTVMNIFSKK